MEPLRDDTTRLPPLHQFALVMSGDGRFHSLWDRNLQPCCRPFIRNHCSVHYLYFGRDMFGFENFAKTNVVSLQQSRTFLRLMIPPHMYWMTVHFLYSTTRLLNFWNFTIQNITRRRLEINVYMKVAVMDAGRGCLSPREGRNSKKNQNFQNYLAT
ncbi:hypothetical protein Y032_0003g1617 [Ancylostoma ceylanicum]|uniref:Uncharacterized protein n=1 Tax=Ancylostoma ceylanicum TaxID=53326 RepID=A0A016VYN8_9BILA|nr:hypothetical protein Y032_0003g1617 [Ancylostoma ceylanicum]